MIDQRYHIYSIAAVFFALAIGIILGTSMARSPESKSESRAIRQYEQWMHRLRGEIEEKTKENARMEDIAKKNEEFCQATLPIVASQRLAWRNVAIIRTGDYSDLTGSIKRVLEMAGAQVTTVTEISRNFPFDDEEKTRQVLANCGVWLPDSEKASDKLWRILATAITSPRHAALLPKLEAAGVAKFTGTYDKSVRLLVIVGGSSSDDANTSEMVDSPLIAQLNKPTITIAACETTDAGSSYVPVWQKMGIATVDNANTAIGQVALICALNGERASFGVKDSADRMIPRSLEQQ